VMRGIPRYCCRHYRHTEYIPKRMRVFCPSYLRRFPVLVPLFALIYQSQIQKVLEGIGQVRYDQRRRLRLLLRSALALLLLLSLWLRFERGEDHVR